MLRPRCDKFEPCGVLAELVKNEGFGAPRQSQILALEKAEAALDGSSDMRFINGQCCLFFLHNDRIPCSLQIPQRELKYSHVSCVPKSQQTQFRPPR